VRLPHVLIRRNLQAFGIAGGVVALDLWTKRHASLTFRDDPVDVIPGFLDFTFVENSGGAFGMFPGGGQLIGVAAVIVTLVVLWALTTPRAGLEIISLGLVLGGAIGNLVDRFARGEGLIDGAVIDWINLWVIPTFNLADASVTIAVGLLLIHAWRAK